MFIRELDMAASVARWMKSSGLVVKSEFVTPWGICDLVGLSFNERNVAHRLALKQTRAVSSITRAALLLQVPDVETKRATTIPRLVQRCAPTIPPEVVHREVARLIADRFVMASFRGRLQKVNGWIPLQDRLVAVELKLSRIDQAMHQALRNLGFTQESYVGLPAHVARRIVLNRLRWAQFFDAGVGLLSVASKKCDVLIPARPSRRCIENAIRLYCVEKFWRTRLRGN